MKGDEGKGPSRALVMVSLFLVRGPLGLGMLWKSERFERSEKRFLTFVVVIYTLALIAAFWYAGRVIMEGLGA